MRMGKVRVLVPVLSAALAGCTTLVEDERAQEEMEQRVTVENLQVEMTQLRQEVRDAAAAQQQIFKEIDTLRADMSRRQSELNARVESLSRSASATAAQQQQIRDEVVSDLSKRMANMMKPAAPARQARRAETGYEHVVQTGETLSAIAAAYRVTPQAIVQANSLTNPNSLRVGQKLFIPE